MVFKQWLIRKSAFKIQALFLFFFIASCTAWSEKKQRDTAQLGFQKKHSAPDPVNVSSEDLLRFEEGHESKLKPRFTSAGHSSGGDKYILEEDEGHVVGEDDGEFIDEEGHEDDYRQEQERGFHHDDKKVDDETQKDFKQTGAYQDFSQGGAVFDKHHKDHESENKENEDIKQHDAGEKFGSEALKEHKLGKHKEKSKGHKKYGFKNVYHKEEYGDHKTFHDEFLDNDHVHDYDDKHEHKQMQGGRFAKGYKKLGENKEHDVGDEKHAWGKAGHDGKAEGFYEKGGHLAGHHLGHKKQEGHYDANGRYGKKSSHKVRKGEVPAVSSVYHQGGDEPQYYSQVYHAQDHPAHLHDAIHDPHYGSYHARHSGIRNDQDKPTKVYADRGFPEIDAPHYHEKSLPGEARRLEVPVNERYSEKDIEKVHQSTKDNPPIRENMPPNEAYKVQTYHYMHPESEHSFPNQDRINKYRQQHSISDPLKSFHHHQPLPAAKPSKSDLPVPHAFQNIRVNQQFPRSHYAEGSSLNHSPRDHGHHHFLIHPRNHKNSRVHQHHQNEDQGISKPYPWWEASSTARKHHQTRDFNPSPSYQHYGYVEVPEQTTPLRHSQPLSIGDHEPAASQRKLKHVREPKKVEWKRVESHHRHI